MTTHALNTVVLEHVELASIQEQRLALRRVLAAIDLRAAPRSSDALTLMDTLHLLDHIVDNVDPPAGTVE